MASILLTIAARSFASTSSTITCNGVSLNMPDVSQSAACHVLINEILDSSYSSYATSAQNCYSQIAYGSVNCCLYCDAFPGNGRHQLSQVYQDPATGTVTQEVTSCEFCDKVGEDCTQVTDETC